MWPFFALFRRSAGRTRRLAALLSWMMAGCGDPDDGGGGDGGSYLLQQALG